MSGLLNVARGGAVLELCSSLSFSCDDWALVSASKRKKIGTKRVVMSSNMWLVIMVRY